MKKLPIYKAVIKNENQGMFTISFVDEPATEINWMAFEKQEQPLTFSIDNDKHIVRGVVMAANKPIYRIKDGYEFYVTYDADTIRLMAQKYFKDGFQNNVDTNHSFNLEDGVYLQEMFIKNTEQGIDPKGFEDVEDGSLFAQYKVENEDIWKQVKDGTFNGFSLAGLFDVIPIEEDEQEYNEVVDLINKIKNKIYK